MTREGFGSRNSTISFKNNILRSVTKRANNDSVNREITVHLHIHADFVYPEFRFEDIQGCLLMCGLGYVII